LELVVTLDELERMWNHDDRDEPTLPGPTLVDRHALRAEVIGRERLISARFKTRSRPCRAAR
jgi:hypothetical protein